MNELQQPDIESQRSDGLEAGPFPRADNVSPNDEETRIRLMTTVWVGVLVLYAATCLRWFSGEGNSLNMLVMNQAMRMNRGMGSGVTSGGMALLPVATNGLEFLFAMVGFWSLFRFFLSGILPRITLAPTIPLAAAREERAGSTKSMTTLQRVRYEALMARKRRTVTTFLVLALLALFCMILTRLLNALITSSMPWLDQMY